jgi:hypothetical protein
MAGPCGKFRTHCVKFPNSIKMSKVRFENKGGEWFR